MLRTMKRLATLTMLSAILFIGPGCATPQRADAAPAAKPADPPPPPATTTAATDKADQAEKDAKEKAKQARERDRKLTRLQRNLDIAKLNLNKAQLGNSQSAVQHEIALARAETDLDIARQELKVFNEITLPNRIARAELSLQWAEDGLREAQEELDQLIIMYKDDQFADQTKEIVIDRAKRRLERTQRDLELRREELQTLKTVDLPRERREKVLAVQRAEQAVERLKQDRRTAEIGEQVGLINSEMEVTRLEEEISDIKLEIADAAEQAKAAPSKAPE